VFLFKRSEDGNEKGNCFQTEKVKAVLDITTLTGCLAYKIEVVIINQGDEVSFEEELAQDVLEIITVFSARLYGSRSHKNKKLIEAAKVLAE
jgi:predicted site-specific integrase-resolvase